MTPSDARDRLDSIAARWQRRHTAALAIRALALALPLIALAVISAPGDSSRFLAALLAVAGAVAVSRALSGAALADASLIARHLDRQVPALEESTTLLLGEDALRPLERLQRDRLLPIFAAVEARQVFRREDWRRPAGEAVVGLLVALILLVAATRIDSSPRTAAGARPGANAGADTGVVLGPLDDIEILIEPPTYTALPPRLQTELDVEAEAGARVTWRLAVAAGSEEGLTVERLAVELITGSGERLPFEADGAAMSLATTVIDSTAYRLVASRNEGRVQETRFASLEVLPDDAPQLAVVSPAERLSEIAADSDSIELEIRARDDYGIIDAELVATLALGSGELVEFRERRIPLEDPRGADQATFRHRFDLSELGIGPAAELYFHVEARDNQKPEPNIGRSATTIVRVAGDQAASADLGEGLPIILPPTYFRSQRQIIIDTEKLIAESPDLDGAEIRYRSEALAGDQRALRMRYGALLGEEFFDGQALAAGANEGGEEEHAEHAGEKVESDSLESVLEALPGGMFHQHDSADIATYFASETRDKLKRVLAEMWDAEGRLRVINPDGALPYENRALVLLKELQQASRIYVQKVGFEAPPLEPETRRLTGELDEIQTRYEQMPRPAAPEVEAAARALLAALSGPDTGGPDTDEPDTGELEGLQADLAVLLPEIARLASRRPQAAEALGALGDLEASRRPDREAQQSLEATLWSLLPPPDPTPRLPVPTSDELSRHYQDLRADGEER